MTRRGTPVCDLDGLIRACVARRRELGLTQLQLDALAGIQDGYTGKWEAGIKGLGRMSLGSLLGALRLELIVGHADYRGILYEKKVGFSGAAGLRSAKKLGREGAMVTNQRHAKRKTAWGRKGALKRWRIWRAIKADQAQRESRGRSV